MESTRYKGKGLGRNEYEIEELPRKMFNSNEGKSGLGKNKVNQKNLVSYSSGEDSKVESNLQSINMVELASKNNGKSQMKANAHASSNAYAHVRSCTNPSTYANKIDCDSSYLILNRTNSKFVDVFEMDYALMNTLGT